MGARAIVDVSIFALGVVWLIFISCLPVTTESDNTYMDVERHAGRMLREGHRSDLTQDVIGFRALCRNQDAYPILGPAMQKLGIDWDIQHVSTHPPTAFLLVAPIAWMPIQPGALVWAWMMLACLAISFMFLGCSAMCAVGLSLLCLAWPPVAMSLGQLTCIWMLGVSGAYRYLATHPKMSGAMLGLAAATKMAPAIMIVFLLRRPKAVVSFVIFLAILGSTLLVVSHKSITRYVQVVEHTVPQQSGRPDNGSFVGQAHHKFGRAGLAASVAFLAVVLLANQREVRCGSLAGWATAGYLAVACLPILWVYSLVPLLFLGRWAYASGWLAMMFFVTFMAATTALHTWNTPILLASAVIWLGVGVVVTGLVNRGESRFLPA